jgi:DNA invertase Pin-like site-specific DNA recombinase
MDGKFIAYYRVSTEHQGANGNGCAAQIQRRVALAVARSRSCARRFGPMIEGYAARSAGQAATEVSNIEQLR